MIVDSQTMREMESASKKTVIQLMEEAGLALSSEISALTKEKDRVLILAGKDNNGGDGFVIARLLKNRNVKVYLVDGIPKTKAAKRSYDKLDKEFFIKDKDFKRELEKADCIVDAVYGFGFHGSLSSTTKKIFQLVNQAHKLVISVDINSGAEADSDFHDRDSIRSTWTLAIDQYKPFHMLRKQHLLFEHTKCLPLDLPTPSNNHYYEMNEELFFRNFPKRNETAYKGTNGKVLLVGGCYGMAGALGLNIVGAKTLGSSYINVCLPESIYPILASHFLTPVFHPFGDQTYVGVLKPLIQEARSIGFGSGAVYMYRKEDVLDIILQDSSVPIVLDAEALRLLVNNTYILRFAKAPVVITPHIGEFAAICNKTIEYIKEHRIETALEFAKDYKVIVVLKGPNTIVVSPCGDIYINQSGNQALAQAGSGDLLTGILTSMLSYTRDTFQATMMSVWLHGYLAELGTQKHSIQNFSLEDYPNIMNDLFYKHGF